MKAQHNGSGKAHVVTRTLLASCIRSDLQVLVFPDRFEAIVGKKVKKEETLPIRTIRCVLTRVIKGAPAYKLLIITRDGEKHLYDLGSDTQRVRRAILKAMYTTAAASAAKATHAQRTAQESGTDNGRMKTTVSAAPAQARRLASGPLFQHHRYGFDLHVYPDRIAATKVNKPRVVIDLRRIATVEVSSGLLSKLVITTSEGRKFEYQLGVDNGEAHDAIQEAMIGGGWYVEGQFPQSGHMNIERGMMEATPTSNKGNAPRPVDPTIRIRQAALARQIASVRTSAGWFFWIAGLTAINSILNLLKINFTMPQGLVTGQFIEGFAKGLGGPMIYPAAFLDLALIGIFALLGVLARNRHSAAFMAGLVLYGLDTLVLIGVFLLVMNGPLASQAMGLLLLGGGFHLLALYSIHKGWVASRKAHQLEQEAGPRTVN